MKLFICFLLGISLSVHVCSQSLNVTNLACEHQANPLGIDEQYPRLSWQLQSEERNVIQDAYQLRVAESMEQLEGGRKLIWDSGRVSSGQSLYIPYAGPALEAGKRYYWQVRVWNGQGRSSGWSAPAWWEMGLGGPEKWQGKW
ncbi:MAG: alpha-L-rhamnosidase, partial [Phaeodactylibacter sp.]|nr:alpha-L-rhamnosidase [Phaeodactylibacter sp.]